MYPTLSRLPTAAKNSKSTVAVRSFKRVSHLHRHIDQRFKMSPKTAKEPHNQGFGRHPRHFGMAVGSQSRLQTYNIGYCCKICMPFVTHTQPDKETSQRYQRWDSSTPKISVDDERAAQLRLIDMASEDQSLGSGAVG